MLARKQAFYILYGNGIHLKSGKWDYSHLLQTQQFTQGSFSSYCVSKSIFCNRKCVELVSEPKERHKPLRFFSETRYCSHLGYSKNSTIARSRVHNTLNHSWHGPLILYATWIISACINPYEIKAETGHCRGFGVEEAALTWHGRFGEWSWTLMRSRDTSLDMEHTYSKPGS